MEPDINRRKFLGSAAASAAAFTIVPRHVPGQGFVAPSDKITLAHVGFGTEAIRELESLLENPSVQLTAVCDVEKDGVRYLEWAPNGTRDTIRRLIDEPNWREGKDWVPGGRDVGKEVIETYYAKKRAAEKFRGVNTYIDFREMLEQETDLDGVKVMTPDHLHAIVAIAAMNRGKHVMVAKPLANRLSEGRLMVETARRTKVTTHFMPANISLGLRNAAAGSRKARSGSFGKFTTGQPVRFGRSTLRCPPTGLPFRRISIGVCGWVRILIGLIIRGTRTLLSGVGTTSEVVRSRTWAFTATGRCSRRSNWMRPTW